MRRYATHISEEDFRKLYPDILGKEKPINSYYAFSHEVKPYVIAVHKEGDTYFSKEMLVFNKPIILLANVHTVRRTRDYFEVNDGIKVYKIKKAETKAIYKITD